MGARIHYVFITDNDMPNLVLYSHWGETFWREQLAAALAFAKPRLSINDSSYATKMIIDQLTKDGRDDEHGFGIYLAPSDMDYMDTSVEIDMINHMVNDSGNWHSFDSFVEYQQEVVENHTFA